jgi:hypothetical protein
MKKCYLLAYFLFVTPAYAQWTLLFSDTNTNTSWFYDAGSIGLIPQNQLWTKAEHAVPVKEMRSSRTLIEFDCRNMKQRYLMFSAYNMSDLQGTTLYSNARPDDWEPVAPYSAHHEYFKFVCKR